MVDSWPKPITVEEMYGDWDYEAAVELLEHSLNPRRAASIFDTVEAVGIGADDVVLDIGGRDGHHGLVMAERFGCRRTTQACRSRIVHRFERREVELCLQQ